MKINNPLCATEYGNTGYGDCFLEPAKIVGAFQVPSTFAIAESNVPGLLAFLKTKVSADYSSRLFPYHQFASVTDNSEDVSITTTDYGFKYVNRDGFYDFTFRYFTGGVQYHQEIGKNAGSNKYFLFYDSNNVLYGYKSNGTLKGIPVDVFYVNPWKFATGADAATYHMRFIINPIYMNKGNLGFLKSTKFNFFDIAGLQDVDFELVAGTGNTPHVKVYSRISKVDLYDAFSTNFAQSAAWKAVNENGLNCPITTAVVDSTNKAWTITLDTTVFNASDKIYLQLAPAATLAAAPVSVVGYDSTTPLVVEAPMS